MVKRPKFGLATSLNAKRFEMIKEPKASTKTRHQFSFDFNKITRRKNSVTNFSDFG